MDQPEPALLHQQLEREVVGSAGAGGGDAQAPGPRLRLRGELAIAGDRGPARSGEHDRHGLDRPDHGEVAGRVVGRVLRRRRGHRDRAARAEHQGVAVRRPLHDLGGRDHAAATGAVLDHHLLAEDFRQRGRDRARGDVDVAARCERHDDAHRLVGKILCGGAGQHRHAAREQQRAEHGTPHRKPPLHPMARRTDAIELSFRRGPERMNWPGRSRCIRPCTRRATAARASTSMPVS